MFQVFKNGISTYSTSIEYLVIDNEQPEGQIGCDKLKNGFGIKFIEIVGFWRIIIAGIWTLIISELQFQYLLVVVY